MSEATVRSFPSYSCSEHFRKYQRKSPYFNDDCLWKLCLYLDFSADFLVNIQGRRNEKNSGGATKFEILSAIMVGRQRAFFISNRLKRLEKFNISRRVANVNFHHI